jgi:hypothetical protein
VNSAGQFIDRLLGDRDLFRMRSREGSFVLPQRVDPSEVLTWGELNRLLNYSGAPKKLVRDGKVFVIQISGEKRWRIYDPPISDPVWVMKNHRYDLSESEPRLDVVLNAGDVLFLRRGDPHEVACVGDDASLHVNLRIFPTTGQSLLDWLVQEAVELPWMRRSMPYALDGDDSAPERVAWVGMVVRELTSWLASQDASELLDQYLNHRAASAEMPGLLSLPTLACPPAARLAISVPITLAHPMIRARISGKTLYALGQVIELPEDLVPVVASLLQSPGRNWTVAQLAVVHGLPTTRVGNVLAELTALGLIRLATDQS